MQLLHRLITRRTFLRLSAALSVIAAELHMKKTSIASQLDQSIPELGGYGVGAYSQGSYPGTINKIYLPIVSKE